MPRTKSSKVNNTSITTKIANNVTKIDIPKYMIDSYYQYISYIVAGRVTCNYKDGFLNIHRRILYAASQIARKNNVKSARLDGETIGKYSPHGSCYDAIVKLVGCGFLLPKGSFENVMGVEREDAAASRYTEVRLNPLSEVLFMNKELMPYVDYKETELSTIEDKYYEPLFLPVLLPGIYTALAETSEFNSYMALNLSTKYPRYSVISLLDYTLNYLKTKEFKPSILYYQYHNLLKQCKDDTSTTFSVDFKSPCKLDEKDNVHVLATLPFIDLANRLKNIAYEDLSSNTTDIVIKHKDYKSDLFKSTANFNVKAYELIDNNYDNVILNDYPIRYAISTIIDNLKNIILPRFFEDKINKVKEQISEYQLLQSIRKKYIDDKVPYIDLTDEEKSCASRHSTSVFMTLDEKLINLNQELNLLIKRSNDIDNEVLLLYTEAREKAVEYISKSRKTSGITMYDITNI